MGPLLTIDDKIRNEKPYDINKEAGKTLELSSGKVGKYEYLTGEEIFPSYQSKMIEKPAFTYSVLGETLGKNIKAIEKQKKAVEEHGNK